MIKKRGILQSMIIKDPLEIDYENENLEKILEKIEFAIEQHPSFLKVIPKEEIEVQKKLDITRLDIINCSHKNSVKLINKTLNNTITDRYRMFIKCLDL